MRVPISWLKEFVDITWPIEELAERLTFAGLEVAAIEKVGDWWDRDKIVVGEIIEVRPHPNADRLTLAVVEYGGPEPEVVVTGAPNVRVGDKGLKAPFARKGARLIDGHAEGQKFMELKGTKIRGVYSESMVCSEKELGLSDDHTGIILLDPDAPVGMPLQYYLGDTVLVFDLTPNLSRCFSVIGVAREVAALTGAEFRLEWPTMRAEGEPIEGQIELEISDPDLCSRYTATLIRGVKICPSPFWMRHRLRLAGMRPINNVVDITNYVMWEWGQPLHAFDYDKLRGHDGGYPPVIIVRRARPGEKITTLDGEERQLSPDMLLITDGGGPVAVAGVMGGLESEVTEETVNVLLEAANFNYISNRRTSKALKLPSEASARFSRGIPAELTIPAATRATELMRKLSGGKIAQGIADLYPVKQKTVAVEITPAEVERIIGMEVSRERIVEILESLEFACEVKDELIHATVPWHRLDVEYPADLVEEIARVIGYGSIPATLMRDELPPQRRNLSLEGEERVRDILVGCGLDEVITYSLTSLKSVSKLGLSGADLEEKNYIKISNPLSSEREYMRRTLMASLLETVRDNLRYAERVSIFEVARVYLPREGKELPDEPRRLCIAMTGPREEHSWLAGPPDNMDFYDLKGVLETLLARLGAEGATFEPGEHPTFHPGRTAFLKVDGRVIGVLGEVHPMVRENFDLPNQPVCLLELDLEALLEKAKPIRHMEAIPRFPPVTQDIALVVDEEVPAKVVEEHILQAGSPLLTKVALFDLYRGEQIPPGKKSLAYSLTFQSQERTLKDREVAKVQERIVQHLKRKLGAVLRA